MTFIKYVSGRSSPPPSYTEPQNHHWVPFTQQHSAVVQQQGHVTAGGTTGLPLHSLMPGDPMPRTGNMATQHGGVPPHYPVGQQGIHTPPQNIITDQNGTMAQPQGQAPPYSPQQTHSPPVLTTNTVVPVVPIQNTNTTPASAGMPVYAVNQTNGNGDTLVLVRSNANDGLASKYLMIVSCRIFQIYNNRKIRLGFRKLQIQNP